MVMLGLAVVVAAAAAAAAIGAIDPGPQTLVFTSSSLTAS